MEHEQENTPLLEPRFQLSLPSWTLTALAWLLCIGAVVAAGFVVQHLNSKYEWFSANKKSPHRIAVVDVDAVLDIYKKDFVVAMSATKLADSERERANEAVRRATIAVGVAVKTIASECECILMVRTALFNPEVVDDHTDLLAQKTSALLKKADSSAALEK